MYEINGVTEAGQQRVRQCMAVFTLESSIYPPVRDTVSGDRTLSWPDMDPLLALYGRPNWQQMLQREKRFLVPSAALALALALAPERSPSPVSRHNASTVSQHHIHIKPNP